VRCFAHSGDLTATSGSDLANGSLFIAFATLVWAFDVSPELDTHGQAILPSEDDVTDEGLVLYVRAASQAALILMQPAPALSLQAYAATGRRSGWVVAIGVLGSADGSWLRSDFVVDCYAASHTRCPVKPAGVRLAMLSFGSRSPNASRLLTTEAIEGRDGTVGTVLGVTRDPKRTVSFK
jgi:hypothetical protein